MVDEAPAMDPIKKRLVANAMNFFDRAKSSGHDVRVAVAGMDPTKKGAFCDSDGKGARFLGPDDRALFEACMGDPPGSASKASPSLAAAQAAVMAHLPRTEEHPLYVRTNAILVIIVASNRLSTEAAGVLEPDRYEACALSTSEQNALSAAASPHVAYFAGVMDPEATAMVHIVGGVCNNSCGAPVSHGHGVLAQKLGGQAMDICQPKLGNTMQLILDSTVGCCCGAPRLDQLPISATLAMASDATRVPRSRVHGFDYRPNVNGVVVINLMAPGSFWAWSYYRWVLP